MPGNVAVEAKVQDINFIYKFTSNLNNLLAMLGKTEVTRLSPGTAYRIYKTAGTLSTQTVAEKALIPDSGITVDDGTIVEITYKKYRNTTSIEEVAKKGYDVAVGAKNDKVVRQIQQALRQSLFAGLAVSGIGTTTAATFQAKVAKAAAYVSKKFEDEAITPVFMANTDDVYDYLGGSNTVLAQNFGLSYLENFMGIGNVIVDSNVPKGTVYGTAVENLDVIASDVTAIEGMDLTTDESGLIAVHNSPVYENAMLQVVAYTGVTILPVYADCIVKVTTGA